MPYDPLLQWEWEGGAVLPGDDSQAPTGSHVLPPQGVELVEEPATPESVAPSAKAARHLGRL